MHPTVPIRPSRVCSWPPNNSGSPRTCVPGYFFWGQEAGRMSRYWINEGQIVFKSPGRIGSGDLS